MKDATHPPPMPATSPVMRHDLNSQGGTRGSAHQVRISATVL